MVLSNRRPDIPDFLFDGEHLTKMNRRKIPVVDMQNEDRKPDLSMKTRTGISSLH